MAADRRRCAMKSGWYMAGSPACETSLWKEDKRESPCGIAENPKLPTKRIKHNAQPHSNVPVVSQKAQLFLECQTGDFKRLTLHKQYFPNFHKQCFLNFHPAGPFLGVTCFPALCEQRWKEHGKSCLGRSMTSNLHSHTFASRTGPANLGIRWEARPTLQNTNLCHPLCLFFLPSKWVRTRLKQPI